MSTDPSLDRSQQVRELFARAFEIPPERRAEFLCHECADGEVRTEVARLFDRLESAKDDFLESPAAAFRAHPIEDWARTLVGQRIGQYTLLRPIANGGMGCVFLARQEHPSRSVALKLLAPGLSAASALARFRLEPELLGRLKHPNIAQVYEAGVHDGETGPLPFFAMELVADARPIDEYALEQGASVRRRLELFVKVCDAVFHGHQKGVIHRDLKPANILVGTDGEPKVIDFGVARATDADLLLTTQHTQAGDLIGTVLYMSPEQCAGDSSRIDTRTDVYSLGVLLYELLTGEIPYATRGKTPLAAMRIITEEAPRSASEHVRTLRGDIDAILAHALEKDPALRYASAADLARDIRHHLSGEPIEARPPSPWTRLARWIGRRPFVATAFICTMMVVAAWVLASISVWYFFSRPDRLHYDENSGDTRLVALSGAVLHRWSDTNRLVVTRLLDRPDSFGGGRLALVARPRGDSSDDGPVLKAFNVDATCIEPVWTATLGPDDLNPYCRERGYSARSFSPEVIGAADIFPSVPGNEIVVRFIHQPNSQRLLRIYDLTGRTRYQVWVDGSVSAAYWMRDAGLLVVGGNNSIAFWEERDIPPDTEIPFAKSLLVNAHPLTLAAIQPKLDLIQDQWLASRPEAAPPCPVWYFCVWPPRLSFDFQRFDFQPPNVGSPGDSVFVVMKHELEGADVTFELSVEGEMIPGTFRPGDLYDRPGHDLPDLTGFELRPLPPIKGVSEEPRVTPIPRREPVAP